MVESVLLRPLPYPNSKQLVFIGPPNNGPGFSSTSWLNYTDIRSQSHQLEAVAGYSEDVSVVETADESESVLAPRVTPNLFSMLGAQPLIGRTFTAADGEQDGPQVVVISAGLWKGSFHSDPGIVGRTVKIGGRARMVVGVMPAAFHFPESMGPDLQKGLWLPLQPTGEMLKDRGYDFFLIVGRLREGANLEQLQQEMKAITARTPRTKDDSVTMLNDWSYQELLTGSVRPVLFGLFAALGLVLLIACANVSNLLIARCLGRRQEFAVRAALGANRSRLMRQLLVEGFMLSFAGCILGVDTGRARRCRDSQASRWHHSPRRCHLCALDDRSCAGGHRRDHYNPLVTFAGTSGGSGQSAGGIAGSLARIGLAVGGRKDLGHPGVRRSCALDAAAGRRRTAFQNSMES